MFKKPRYTARRGLLRLLFFAVYSCDSFGTGFAKADALWNNIQKNMVSYINANGGQAVQQAPVIARPNWNDVKDYLQGKIDFTELKRRLGC